MRLVVAMPVIMGSQAMVRFITMMPLMAMTGDFALVAVVPGRAILDCMPMLTGMSVMRAASENRMQQHHRHRQNAGQGLKHEVSTALQTQSRHQRITTSLPHIGTKRIIP